MFLKPIRVKSNSQMKNSERKALRIRIMQTFRNLKEGDVEKIFTNKDAISVSKIITHSNNVCSVYLVNKRPMLFQHEETLYPTVYFLWNFPGLLKCFTTHAPVISKLSSGADLMLPGVILPNIEGPARFGRFEKGLLVGINITTNKAVFAIGTTAHSSMDMYMAAGRGKCVNVIHSLYDHLCQMEGSSPPPVVELGIPDWLKPEEEKLQVEEEEKPKMGDAQEKSDSKQAEDEASEENIVEVPDEIEDHPNVNSTEGMDSLLIYCFLKALRYSGKKITLPCLTSNFYRTHIINACPKGKHLDIKKSSYKKLNKFLNEMKSQGVLNVTEQTKGVETITTINFDHPMITSFMKSQHDISAQMIGLNKRTASIDIKETYTVTAAVLPIFSDAGLRKGDAVKSTDVRKYVTDYVKKRKLNSLESRNLVIPNKDLADVIKTNKELTWEELMQKIYKLMSTAYKINCAGAQLSSGKGKVEPIILTIGSRSGNKKVTLVDNLELYGIRAADFGKECQHGVATSTSVSKPRGKKCEQLLIQGNQVLFVGKLLTEKYNIPKRFIRGLELAPKNKK